ncbi:MULTISPECIES: type III secretion system inner membrane ring lipoprotein SctJ [unclassified Caballeronia]|uniref:type III secretion system inner membrane ring lipoprotein SctJ n=1 Tax=unclassified Caballeronia TaxID=2646786 RepID=UPI00202978B2|nr:MULTISPECIES: type III secretion inner membrane ring lipoprotein SctJ [unclassified Caballeronia]
MLLIIVLCLSACRKELYGNLSQQDANDMAVILLEEGVHVAKETPDDGKTWTLNVDADQLVPALRILKERSLPAAQYTNLGELFKKEGIVSTPSEERVRFIYGVSQELSGTLSHIDGVIVARVQIVLPDNDPLASGAKPSSASVFIKYQPNSNVLALVPQIKSLVTHSVEGLTYDQVSVICVPAADRPAVSVTPEAKTSWLAFAGGLCALLCVGIVGGIAWMRYRKRSTTTSSSLVATASVVE